MKFDLLLLKNLFIIIFILLSSNPRFLMIALAYAIPLGVFSGWSGVLDWILTPVHISQVGALFCLCGYVSVCVFFYGLLTKDWFCDLEFK